MKEWKRNQELYHKLVLEHEDDLSNFENTFSEEIVNNALNYFTEKSPIAVYPAKSYAVGIIYATFISEHFNEPFLEVLDDPDLLLGLDPHFVPYSNDPGSYDAIMAQLRNRDNWRDSGWAPQTFKYCRLECTEEGLEEVINGLC